MSALSLQSCNKDSVDRNYAEQTAFMAYITSQNIPEDGYTENNGVYRVVTDNLCDKGIMPRPDGYEGDFPPQVTGGDRVSLVYTISEFSVNLTSATGKKGGVLFSNDQAVIDALNKQEGEGLNGYHPHLDVEYWSTEPLTVNVGGNGIMKGIMEALPGCRLGDILWVLIPSKLAYGDMQTGYFTDNTALYVDILIADLNGIYQQEEP